jgi:tetratricopeptide (TPR) repeat protein
LEPLPPGPEPKLVTWSDVAGAAKPLFLQNPGKTFWFEYLSDHKSLYIQVNAVRNDPGETLAVFVARAVAEAQARGAEKIILDLRGNGGGDNYLNRSLVLSFVQLEELNRYGRIFTIIGRATFSAALGLVSDLERWTETIFVGEPTGNTPSLYGDARRYPLPHSRLTVLLSSVYWRDSDVNERRPWVAPDLAVETSWADFSAGRDPVLEAALDYRVPDTLIGQMKEKYRWGGINAAAGHYFKHRNSPATVAVRTEETLLAMAEFLVAEGKLADATGMLRRAVAEYPESFACQLGLGKRLVEQGAGEIALRPLNKALALKPGDVDAAAWLRKAESLAAAKK